MSGKYSLLSARWLRSARRLYIEEGKVEEEAEAPSPHDLTRFQETIEVKRALLGQAATLSECVSQRSSLSSLESSPVAIGQSLSHLNTLESNLTEQTICLPYEKEGQG